MVDYRSCVEHFRADRNYPAWRYHVNNGVCMTPGADEQSTLFIAHTDGELDHCAAVFEEFARDLTA